MLVQDFLQNSAERFPDKTALICGSYVSTTLIRSWKKHAPNVTFLNAYGQTECVFITNNPGDEFEKRPESVGRPFMNTRLMIEGPDGEKLPPGEEYFEGRSQYLTICLLQEKS